MTFKLSAFAYWTLGLINGRLNSRSFVPLFLHTFMCSPDEGPRRTETSLFFIKSLELKCHAYIIWLFMLLFSNTQDAYLFVSMHYIYMCAWNQNIDYAKHHNPHCFFARLGDVSRKLNQVFLMVDSFNFHFCSHRRFKYNIYMENSSVSRIHRIRWKFNGVLVNKLLLYKQNIRLPRRLLRSYNINRCNIVVDLSNKFAPVKNATGSPKIFVVE